MSKLVLREMSSVWYHCQLELAQYHLTLLVRILNFTTHGKQEWTLKFCLGVTNGKKQNKIRFLKHSAQMRALQ